MLDHFSITVSDYAATGTDDGPLGLRHYHPAYYGAFLRDPDGDKVEAVCHRPV